MYSTNTWCGAGASTPSSWGRNLWQRNSPGGCICLCFTGVVTVSQLEEPEKEAAGYPRGHGPPDRGVRYRAECRWVICDQVPWVPHCHWWYPSHSWELDRWHPEASLLCFIWSVRTYPCHWGVGSVTALLGAGCSNSRGCDVRTSAPFSDWACSVPFSSGDITCWDADECSTDIQVDHTVIYVHQRKGVKL